MAADGGSEAERGGTGPDADELELRVKLKPAPLFAGSIRIAGRSEELPFSGWIEFMSLVNALRTGAEGLPGDPGSDPP